MFFFQVGVLKKSFDESLLDAEDLLIISCIKKIERHIDMLKNKV